MITIRDNPFINKQRTKYVLFLGAGASKAMNIDDLDGITSRVRNSASTQVKDVIDRLDDLFGAIEETDAIFKLDIEVMFTIFNCLANRKQMLNELGPFALLMHYFTKKIPEFMKLEISPNTFEEFKQLVASSLYDALKYSSYSPDQQTRAKQLYEELYKIPIKNDQRYRKNCLANP